MDQAAINISFSLQIYLEYIWYIFRLDLVYFLVYLFGVIVVRRVGNTAWSEGSETYLTTALPVWLFLETFWIFFSRKSLALEKHCLSCIFIKNLLKRV